MEQEAQRRLSQGFPPPHLGDPHVGVGGAQRDSLLRTSQVNSQIVAWLLCTCQLFFLQISDLFFLFSDLNA